MVLRPSARQRMLCMAGGELIINIFFGGGNHEIISNHEILIKNKGQADARPLSILALLAVAISVARHKLVHASGCIDKLRLTGIERVRSVRDLQLDERILNAIDSNRILGSSGRAAEELSTIRHIFENYYSVVIRMNSFFHKNLRFGAFSIQHSVFLTADG